MCGHVRGDEKGCLDIAIQSRHRRRRATERMESDRERKREGERLREREREDVRERKRGAVRESEREDNGRK